MPTKQHRNKGNGGIHAMHPHSTVIMRQGEAASCMKLYKARCRRWLCFAYQLCYGYVSNTIERQTPRTESCTVWFHFDWIWVDFFAQIGPDWLTLNNSRSTWRILDQFFWSFMKEHKQTNYNKIIVQTIFLNLCLLS